MVPVVVGMLLAGWALSVPKRVFFLQKKLIALLQPPVFLGEMNQLKPPPVSAPVRARVCLDQMGLAPVLQSESRGASGFVSEGRCSCGGGTSP